MKGKNHCLATSSEPAAELPLGLHEQGLDSGKSLGDQKSTESLNPCREIILINFGNVKSILNSFAVGHSAHVV